MRSVKRFISLQLVVALGISSCIVLLSLFFLLQAYRGMTTNIFTATEIMAKYVATTINQSVQFTFVPPEVTLNLLKEMHISGHPSKEEEDILVPIFANALGSNPMCSSIFIGYNSGEYSLLRKYEERVGKVHYDGPPKTKFILVSRTKKIGSDGFIDSVSYLDGNLAVLKKNSENAKGFDIHKRVWFRLAKASDKIVTTRAYTFYDTGELGVTMAQAMPDGSAVLGIDITTDDLSQLLRGLALTPGTQMVIVDDYFEIVAYPYISQLIGKKVGPDGSFELSTLGVPVFEKILHSTSTNYEINEYQEGDTHWLGINTTLRSFYGNNLRLLIALPENELLASVREKLFTQGVIAISTAMLILIAGWFLGKWLVRPLQRLTSQVAALDSFDFSQKIGVYSRLSEVNELGSALGDMAEKINGFKNIYLALNKEKDLEHMLSLVLSEILKIVQLNEGAVYLYNGRGVLSKQSSIGDNYPQKSGLPRSILVCSDEEIIDYLEKSLGKDNIFTLLRNRENDFVGLLCIRKVFLNRAEDERKLHSLTQFVSQISGAIAVGIEARKLNQTQRDLLQGVIKLIADAIDAKSQYTGGHCHRVPELSLLIMQKMCEVQDGPFRDFSLNASQEEEFKIAAWLHDCGKLTTPEYVVDKATKLETIYNRIHEVRTRFELLHRDATIEHLQALLEGKDAEQARLDCTEKQEKLQKDFAFIAQCNIGGESMKDEDIARLLELSNYTWTRHFSDRLGLSRDELDRYEGIEEVLPAQEYLLSDKKVHIIPWGSNKPPVELKDPQNIWGFNMKLPKVQYNYGEIYNLSIKRGTLSAEERFKINGHMVQTYCMLTSLPFPETMKSIPDIASNHHETLIGTGYPRKLRAEHMKTPDRIIAVADIFEALTASDRPYKDGKSLRQTFTILRKMVKDGHLDSDIYNLFLQSGAFLEYGKIYLRPSQMDLDIAGIGEYLV